MRFRRGPRKASKIQKKNLIENSKKLAKEPTKVIPECGGDCLFCKFSKSEKKIKKVEKYKDDNKRLEKYAKRGTDLSKAVAGTILFGNREEADQVTTAKTPEGEIAYAKIGKASKKRLMGVQHFEDPKKRLIAFSKESEKGYYFYSLDDRAICTGKEADPPKAFVEEAIERLPYDLEKNGDAYSCGHKAKGEEIGRLKLNWKSTDKHFSICESCAKDSINLFKRLTERMLSEDNSKSFSLKAEIGIRCESDCESCNLSKDVPVSEELAEKYFAGLNDREFIDRYSVEARSVIKNRSDQFIIGDICYGRDAKTFLEHIDHEPWERPSLVTLIKKARGAVLDEGTVNEFLDQYWDSYKGPVLKSVLNDKEAIREVLDKDVRPREKLRALNEMKKKKEEFNALPEFKNLPSEGKFADKIARKYKIKGEDEAINEIEDYNISDTGLKSIAYGFYVAFGKGDSKKWKYEETVVESGEFLSDHIEKLLESTGKDYAENLQRVVKMSGSTEPVVLENGEKMR